VDIMNFQRTAQALRFYDESKPSRDLLWDTAKNNEAVLCAQKVEEGYASVVQSAFYLDTIDINHLEDCLRLGITSLRKTVMSELADEMETARQARLAHPTTSTIVAHNRLVTEWEHHKHLLPVGE
jgi:hypothetical protein